MSSRKALKSKETNFNPRAANSWSKGISHERKVSYLIGCVRK